MITPIKTMTISQIIERQGDLLVSTKDIKELAKNERTNTICEIQNKLKNDYHGMLSDESMKIYEFINYLEEMKEGAENEKP